SFAYASRPRSTLRAGLLRRCRRARADSRGNAPQFGAVDKDKIVLSPPFLPSCTAVTPSIALPCYWFELVEMIIAYAAGDIYSASEEVRAAKIRASSISLESGVDGVMSLCGVGAIKLAESRGFVTGVVEGVRKIRARAEASRREEEGRRF
ncbi:DNA replication complex GINS protein PSF2, partial [Tolypocladium capitatum]